MVLVHSIKSVDMGLFMVDLLGLGDVAYVSVPEVQRARLIPQYIKLKHVIHQTLKFSMLHEVNEGFQRINENKLYSTCRESLSEQSAANVSEPTTMLDIFIL